MMREYVVRASLEYAWDMEQESKREQLTRPWKLPSDIGPFQLDQSPNIAFYLADSGWDTSGRTNHQYPDRHYPVSLLYVETKIGVLDKGNPQARADEVLESLECLLRLFQPGGVSVRRNYYMPRVEGQELKDTVLIVRPVKPVAATHYDRPYPLDDNVLSEFIKFFNKYWSLLQNNPHSHLTIALSRFNSSYERLSLADRIIDLVIALEALFSDGDADSITYKVALRSASWLHPPGEKRLDAFEFAKKLYSERSKVIHGRRQASATIEQVDDLEGIVRASLVKFLDCYVKEGGIPNGLEIDSQIITGKL